MTNWISVEDELPPLDLPVWCYDGKYPFIGGLVDAGDDGQLWGMCCGNPWIYDGSWLGDIELDDEYIVTHWMPLPEPPQ